ncbi:MAG: hypothetical protein PHS04_04135 [Tissierellia bacterium]|nr:hypothetical protein [Tissierellia bacterium]
MSKLKQLFATVFLLFLITGCNTNSIDSIGQQVVQKPLVIEDEYILFVNSTKDYMNGNIGDLYIKKGINEKEKVSSNVSEYGIEFYPDKGIIVFYDKDNNLYIKERGQEKEFVAAEIETRYVLLKDELGIIFQNSDYDLYQKLWGQEKEKISSNVDIYGSWLDFSSDGKTIYFIDKEKNLYYKEDNLEKEKLSSNVSNFILADNGSTIYYQNLDGNLYKRDLSEPDNEKLTTDPVYNYEVYSDGIIYINDYNEYKGKGELYYKYDEEPPVKIASDVIRYEVVNDGKQIYFLNEDYNLLKAELIKQDKEKIAGDVRWFQSDSKYILFSIDGIIYIKIANDEKEKVAEDYKEFAALSDGTFVYSTDESDLYIKKIGEEKVKIASDVQSFTVSEFENSLSYCTNDYKMYLKVFENEETEDTVVIDNVRDYNDVYFSNNLIFRKTLILDDIIGIWHAYANGENILFEITGDRNMNIYENGEIEYSWPAELITRSIEGIDASELHFDTYPNNKFEDYNSVRYINEYEMEINGRTYEKINGKELDEKLQLQKIEYEEKQKKEELQNKIDAAYSKALEIQGTYQYITVEVANLRDGPSMDADILGTIEKDSGFYINYIEVDEVGDIWCYLDFYDLYYNSVSGWCAYSNFE